MKNALFLIALILSMQSNAYFSPLGFSFTTEGEYTQLPPSTWDIYGARFNLLGAENRKVIGLDIGGANKTTELSAGVQFGVLNYNLKTTIQLFQVGVATLNQGTTYILGVQMSIVNYNKGKTRIVGAQFGVVNTNGGKAKVLGLQAGVANLGKGQTIVGWQFGAYNQAYRIIGLQMGIINKAENLHGFQVGVLNYCQSCIIPVMAGINIGL